MIRNIEEQSLNAWPALQTMLYDGWVLRFADGYTRRSNSINPLYRSTLDPAEKVDACERIYNGLAQDTVFKLTAASESSELDAFLERRGYQRAATTSVCSVDLGSVEQPQSTAFEWSSAASDAWLDTFCSLNNVQLRHLPVMRRLLGNLVAPACFGALHTGPSVVALGLAVRQLDSVWLFDIVTAPEYRRQGFGREVVLHLLSWAKARGAKRAYLQVMQNNHPALALYEQLGFQHLYEYWYRVKAFQ